MKFHNRLLVMFVMMDARREGGRKVEREARWQERRQKGGKGGTQRTNVWPAGYGSKVTKIAQKMA